VNAVTTPVIDINNPGNELQLNVFPNPLNNSSIADIFLPTRGHVQAELLNMQGQKLNTIFSGTLSSGRHSLSLSEKTENLPDGIYLLRVQNKNSVNTVKVVIQKF
jgi:hypothetical protein